MINVLPDAMIGEGGHRLVEVAAGQGGDHRQHFGGRQSHQASAVQSGFGEGRRAEPGDFALNQGQIVMRRPFFHRQNITL